MQKKPEAHTSNKKTNIFFILSPHRGLFFLIVFRGVQPNLPRGQIWPRQATHHVTFQTRTVLCGFSSGPDPHQSLALSGPRCTPGARLTQCGVCAPRRGTRSCGFSHRNFPDLSVWTARWCQQRNPFSGEMSDLPEVRRRRIRSPGHASPWRK